MIVIDKTNQVVSGQHRLMESAGSNLQESVKRGAKLLDEEKPGWWQKISLSELDLASCSKCVCGQLFGSIDYALETLEIASDRDAETYFGFNLPSHPDSWDDRQNQWEELENLWVVEIRSRREEVVV